MVIRWLLIASLCACFAAGINAATVVVNFDDLADSGVVPDGYGGINWGGQWTYYGFSQPPYNPSSPPNRVYDIVREGQFSLLTPAVFDGAWFSGESSATVQFNLYLSGLLVASSGVLAPSDVPTFLGSGYAGLVDEVGVVSPAPDHFVMDDVTYGSGTSTPEPATLSLVGGAVGLLAFVVRRRRRA
jgi:hypothetical protein